MSDYDVIVIGAGHNGLTNAAFLAKAGLKVLVLERNDYVGGAAVSRELHEGWIYSNCSYVSSLLRPEIYRALELGRHGLQIIPFGGGVTLTQDGGYFGKYYSPERQHREFSRFSKRDADAYERYSAEVMRYCRFIRPFLLRTPADPTSSKPKDIFELLYLGKKFHDLGEIQMMDFIRFFTMSVGDYLDEFFETDVIKAHLAGSGIIGTPLGPYSPGTAYVLLHHYMGDLDGNVGSWGLARGGMGAITQALSKAVQAHGGDIVTGAEVERILVWDKKTTGVVLSNGDEYRATTVVSNLDVKRTFLETVDPFDLPDDFKQSVENFKIRGASGKVNIALDGPPEFPALPDDGALLSGDFHFTDSLERMERAYDDWKAGRWSQDPYVDMMMPTQTDPTMAPPGKHFMSVFVQYAPPTLSTGEWTDADRDAFGQTVLNQIAEYSPNFKDLILHAEVRTPKDIENEVGLTEGNIFQGELSLEQILFNRPVPGYAQYRSPIAGLYLCGSSTHPGGGVMAAPGANAAREILSDLKKPSVVPGDFGDD
jgi:phytoene dehydrogenase-like protein